jgi:hypothetical protein
MELGKPQTAKLELEIQMLEIYRVELNDYCRAINHQLAGSGLTAQQVIGFLLQIDGKRPKTGTWLTCLLKILQLERGEDKAGGRMGRPYPGKGKRHWCAGQPGFLRQ